jgi:hypothetical protein
LERTFREAKKLGVPVQEVVADMKLAIDNVCSSQWHIDNNKTDIELICRDLTYVERYRDMRAPRHDPTQRTLASREAAMLKLYEGEEERDWAAKVAHLCYVATSPPVAADPIMGTPEQRPEHGREALAALGLDVAEVLSQYEAQKKAGNVFQYGHMEVDAMMAFVQMATGRTVE